VPTRRAICSKHCYLISKLRRVDWYATNSMLSLSRLSNTPSELGLTGARRPERIRYGGGAIYT
jgi:hypothetical protein